MDWSDKIDLKILDKNEKSSTIFQLINYEVVNEQSISQFKRIKILSLETKI